MIETVIELDPAARHPWVVPALYGQLGVLGQEVARLGDALVAGENIPCEDQCLRPRPALSQAASDQQLVCANLAHATLRTVQPAIRSRWRPNSATVGSVFRGEKAGS